MNSVIYLTLTISIFCGCQAQELSCTDSTTAAENVYSFTVPSPSPAGDINMMYIQYDGNRKTPVTSTTLLNSLNFQNNNVSRVDNFRKIACPSVLDKQYNCSITYKTTPAQRNTTGILAFDRGHLTPVAIMKFSPTAVDNTYFCVNIAPQDPYTNQNPWAVIESETRYFFKNKAGYVMTGTCDADNIYNVTADGSIVPDCFWKLTCYKNLTTGTTEVIGFIGNNTLVNTTAEKNQRTLDTTKPRSQADILAKMPIRGKFIEQAWKNAETYLLKNRNEANAPNPVDCINTKTISDVVFKEWDARMKNGVISFANLYPKGTL